MEPSQSKRRRFIAFAAGTLCGALPLAALAQSFIRTPAQALGPFYPLKPLEKDADLVTVAGGSGVAKGEITHLSGRILDSRGRPMKDVLVEIWQCNAYGRYHHPRDSSGERPLDPNFQGFGSATTGGDGSYSFRTIKPVPYPGRTPHIHYRVVGRGFEPFVTQMYVAGHPQNARDRLLMSVSDAKARSTLLANFLPIKAPGGATEYTAQFDIVLGVTPQQS
jgi:protocatechuate 3,4-dioxygenase, beta subunit